MSKKYYIYTEEQMSKIDTEIRKLVDKDPNCDVSVPIPVLSLLYVTKPNTAERICTMLNKKLEV